MNSLDYPGGWLFRRITSVSLRAKIIGMVLGAVLLIGLAMTLSVRARLTADLQRSLQERGIAIARYAAARATDLVLTDNTFALYQLVRDTLENNLDVRYVFVVDAQGQVIVHSFPQVAPSDLIPLNQPPLEAEFSLQPLTSDEGRLLDISVPLLQGQVGVFRVGMSLSRLETEVIRATWQLLTITAVALLIGTGIALFLTRLLTRPVLELVDVTRQVGEGNLDVRAHPLMADEVGELTHAFNAMTENLQASHADLVRRLRELAILNATAKAISSTLDLDEMLQAALVKVLEEMNLQAGWVFLEDLASPVVLRLAAQEGLSMAFAHEEATRELGDCVCAEVLQSGMALVVEDICRQCSRLDEQTIRAENLSCHVSVPLFSRNRVIGVLNVASKESLFFSQEDIALLGSIGRQIGVAAENARLWEEVKEKEELRGQLLEKIITAQESERQRLARELHDEAGQALTSLKFSLRTLEQQTNLEKTHTQLQELRDMVGQIQESLHDLAVEIHPPALDELGLIAALDQFINRFAQIVEIKVEFQLMGLDIYSERLHPEVEVTIYRLIQEAMTNVARHAMASQVSVLLEHQGDQIVIIVEDDGIGFNASEISHQESFREHLGLHSMQERTDLLGGLFTIESRPEEGTTIFARLPLAPTTEPIKTQASIAR
jgi:signal transduction histidine kinase